MNKIGNGIDLWNEKKVPSSTQETNSWAKLALHQVSNPILAYFSSSACALDVSHDKTLLHEFRAQIGCPVTKGPSVLNSSLFTRSEGNMRSINFNDW